MSDWKKNPLVRIYGELINHYLRIVDFSIAQKVTQFVANSKETQRRIRKFYRCDSVVVYPPVEVSQSVQKPHGDFKSKSKMSGGYYLYVNRLAFAKHPELAVSVCTQQKLPLKVVGSGPLLSRLRNMAGPTVEFLGAVSDTELQTLYAGAKALLYPVEDEDFGMIPVEAMSHGVPVIAHASGGPLETIIDTKWQMKNGKKEKRSGSAKNTGIFFGQLTTAGLTRAIERFETEKFDRSAIKNHAAQFDKKQFVKKMKQVIAAV